MPAGGIVNISESWSCPNILELITQNRIESETVRALSCTDDHCGVNPKGTATPVVPALGHLTPLCLAVGTPIEVQKTPHPSQEEVDRLHQRYMKELSNLFEAHKLKYNVPSDQHLEFC